MEIHLKLAGKIPFHLSIPSEQMPKILELMKVNRFRSRTETIQFLIHVGLKINEYKVKCDNPEFVKEVERDWKVEETVNWLDDLPTQQIEIIGRAWEIAIRKRNRELSLH